MSLHCLCITNIIVLALVKSRLGTFALMYLLIKLSVVGFLPLRNSHIFMANKTIEFMFAGINIFWAPLRLILARVVRRGLK